MAADDRSGATGEWVGVLGFSQGAKLCASLLYTQQYCRERLDKEPPIQSNFRFGVLLAGQNPLLWLDSDANAPPGLASDATRDASSKAEAHAMPLENRLRVPTLHVHGLRDPGLTTHRELLKRSCDSKTTQVLEWDGAHSVPLRTADVRLLTEAIVSLAEKTGCLMAQT